jgi:hypothetical protein
MVVGAGALKLERQAEAVRLLRTGLTYDEIAAGLGYRHRSSAWRLIREALQQNVATEVGEYRALVIRRLDALLAAHWARSMSGHVGSARVVLRILEMQCSLLGLTSEAKAQSASRLSETPESGIRSIVRIPS